MQHVQFGRVRSLMASTAIMTALAAIPAQAQQPVEASIATDAAPASDDMIVITGSRIRRAGLDQAAPVAEITAQAITDRGFVTAADALNNLPSNAPVLNQADGSGDTSGPGFQAPNLFNLGTGRTLTLFNGRRMVTTGSGIGAGDGVGDAFVDANIIPLGLLDRVEVYQGGGAAVYGSDAIAGVVNYIVKKDFSGLVLDAQNGISERGDYATPSLRATAGMNFGGGRGNVAIDLGYSKSPTLMFDARPLSNRGRLTVGNSADTGPTDGIPAVKEIFNAAFWPFNRNGVIFTRPAPVPPFLARSSGNALQFAPDGSVVRYDTGAIQGIPFASGGDGFKYQALAGLRTGVERYTANLIGHYDLTDRITLSTELLYARTTGTEIPQGNSYTTLNAGNYAGPIPFTITNPFLSTQARTLLAGANAGFAAGAPLFLSKYFYDLTPANDQTTRTETYRAALALDGGFDVGDRAFYWSLAGSYARVDGAQRSWQVVNSRFRNAIGAGLSGGRIVCAINADAITTNDDAACAPINPFGDGNVSAAARDYVSTRAGIDWTNEQVDLLATFGGTLAKLPTGNADFSVAYEHRDERAAFDPLAANRAGSFGTGTREVAQSGGYNTDELSAELIVPLIGKDFQLPLVRLLEAKGAFRYVDNSYAGHQNVWDLGLRWEVTEGVTLRGSRSRNFRAPTLTQLLAPTVSGLNSVGFDPCDADRIASGPNPAVRRANCLALFAANPGYGVDPDGTGAGLGAAARLARFQDPSENFQRAIVTTGGNTALRNEISNTWTYGILLQPRVVPGLTISADRIEIDLTDGLSSFMTADFAAACYDDPNPSAAVCGAFTRLANSDGVSPGGTIATGTTTTFNAGVVRYRGETYLVDYQFALGDLLGGGDLGRLQLGAAATRNALLTTSVTGTTFVRSDGTYLSPRWVGRFNAAYAKGPLRLTYQLEYLDRTAAGPNVSIETTPNPVLRSNIVHDVSAQVDLGRIALRFGIDNLTDREPSYPQIAYGDILGRRFYAGARIKLK
ncbi:MULTISPECIES: TonB-dependent receptor plug domain-containing protein [unclassified Sphingomonas]|uniref:TonB-dependent receptor plug domain-containing protein n=1 Tax=unclassified Sphingomonas TaxID=196159 RepID=UPI0007017E2D|nr:MULTISPECIES: TonB-dependent receptor plug domain-containing protein [unclassified Sphingomonas]KQM62305.1 TonB-dependent receptor [Sphingomonas sp. Leaf16]KQN13709.1 TonB-dependent receptor [Sphingomonas sp. Leaf29]KQN23061.1 TonB-dependent receptor [Sphingomonas sp. Leaf32]